MADTRRLEKIKRRLGIEPDDKTEDLLITDLIDDAEAHFKGLTGAESVADKYAYIIDNVVYKMYQRKGSEAVEKETVDGYSVTYTGWADFFEPYKPILDRDFGGEDSSGRKAGKVVVLY
ncbi:phage head-tail connector protein [Streptococcus sp. H31]|uniref:phage head-tail connector protein n=1 Tax=Streptococcus huangxiaojuni TaxID=3237239 RepID=UPI0034A4641D